MRYSRTELLARVDATRAAFVAETVAEVRRRQDAYDAELERWRRDVAPVLHQRLAELARRAANGQPVCRHDLDAIRSYGEAALTFNAHERDRPTDVDVSKVAIPQYLVEIENVLRSLTDDVVSAHALESAGVLRHVRRLKTLALPSAVED